MRQQDVPPGGTLILKRLPAHQSFSLAGRSVLWVRMRTVLNASFEETKSVEV